MRPTTRCWRWRSLATTRGSKRCVRNWRATATRIHCSTPTASGVTSRRPICGCGKSGSAANRRRALRSNPRNGRLSWDHLRQQAAVALHRLLYRQTKLDFPAARRHRVHHRHAEVLLQQIDDRQYAPAGAEEVDRVGLAVLEEGALDVGIDLFGGKLADLVERHVDARHGEHVEARGAEVIGEHVIDGAGE